MNPSASGRIQKHGGKESAEVCAPASPAGNRSPEPTKHVGGRAPRGPSTATEAKAGQGGARHGTNDLERDGGSVTPFRNLRTGAVGFRERAPSFRRVGD